MSIMNLRRRPTSSKLSHRTEGLFYSQAKVRDRTNWVLVCIPLPLRRRIHFLNCKFIPILPGSLAYQPALSGWFCLLLVLFLALPVLLKLGMNFYLAMTLATGLTVGCHFLLVPVRGHFGVKLQDASITKSVSVHKMMQNGIIFQVF